MKKVISVILSLTVISLILCSCSAKEDEAVDVQLKYTYDSIYGNMDSSVIRAYETLCDAVVNGDTDAGINTGLLAQANQLFYTSFPLSDLVSDIQPNSDNSGVVIKYKNGSEIHSESVKAFTDKINGIVSECKKGTTNDLEYIVKAYNYVASNADIDSTNASHTLYSTIMSDKVNAFTYTSMFEYLLNQNDIEANHIIATKEDGSSGAVSGALINGQYYFFDVGAECNINSGKGINFFGMTSEDLKERGFTKLVCTNGSVPPDASDLKFDPCRNSTAWELREGALLVTAADGTVVKITQN